MNISNFKIPNNKEITMFLEKFAQNSMNLCEEKINLLKNSLDLKYQKILNEYFPYLKYRIEFYKNIISKQSQNETHRANSNLEQQQNNQNPIRSEYF